MILEKAPEWRGGSGGGRKGNGTPPTSVIRTSDGRRVSVYAQRHDGPAGGWTRASVLKAAPLPAAAPAAPDLQGRRQFTHIPDMMGGPAARMTPEHRYVTPEGQTYDSVTTILGATKSDADKRGLEEWRESVGAGVADYIMQEAAAIGTQAHLLNEYYLNGIVPDESDGEFRLIARAHHENFRPYLDRIDQIRGTELVLHSDMLKLAGTSDCIAEYDGVLSIIDYKTKRSSQRPEWMHDYFLQAAAYAVMYRGLSGVEVKQAVIMASSEQDTMQVFRAPIADFVDEFMERLNMYRGRPAPHSESWALFEDVQMAASMPGN